MRGFGFYFWRRLESADEFCAEKAGERGAATHFVLAARFVGDGLHRADVDAIRGGEVVEAFRDAPGGGIGAPGGLGFGEAGDEGFGVGLSCGVGVVEKF